MITRIYVDNYKKLVDFEMKLGKINLFSGRNGSGKSSVFDVVHAFDLILSDVAKFLDPETFPSNSLTAWLDKTIQTFEMDVLLSDSLYRYHCELEHNLKEGKSRVKSEYLTMNDSEIFKNDYGDISYIKDNGEVGPTFKLDWSSSGLARLFLDDDRISNIAKFIQYMKKMIIVCKIDTVNIVSITKSEDEYINSSALNFVSWYKNAINERPDLVQEFYSECESIFNNFKHLKLKKHSEQTRELFAVFNYGKRNIEISFDSLSDGQRQLIVIYALIMLSGEGASIFLDEPDNYIGLRELQPWLELIMDQANNHNKQITIITHHPEILDHMGEDVGYLFKEIGSSGVSVNKMSEILSEEEKKSGMKISEIMARGWE